MTRPSLCPPLNTFVVRFWRERSADDAHWRGTIEHVQSGMRAAFLDLAGLEALIHRFGIMFLTGDEASLDGEGQRGEEENC